ncbi:hypothetical protein LINGRAPRIM_LOCUS1924, partial [Linum grandiflorum]
FLSLLSPIFLSIFFECMIESGFVFTQISTANLDLHTKRLGSARNPPKRLGFGSCFSGDSFRSEILI